MAEVNKELITKKVGDIQPNSHLAKQHPQDDGEEVLKKTGKVVSGKVVKKAPGAGKKLSKMFLSEDVPNIKEYLLFEWLVPTIKDAFVDGVQSAIDLAFYGKVRPRKGGTRSSLNGSYYDYSGRSKSARNATSPRARVGYEFDDIYLESAAEAEEVLDVLCEIIEDYGKVSVGDFYDALGMTGNGPADRTYGWTDLRNARIARSREGYNIVLPRVQNIRP